ncbi:hypothetical protein D3C81_1021540 [compost metagenome]
MQRDRCRSEFLIILVIFLLDLLGGNNGVGYVYSIEKSVCQSIFTSTIRADIKIKMGVSVSTVGNSDPGLLLTIEIENSVSGTIVCNSNMMPFKIGDRDIRHIQPATISTLPIPP